MGDAGETPRLPPGSAPPHAGGGMGKSESCPMRSVLQLGETVLMVYALRTFGWVLVALRRFRPGLIVRVRPGVRCGGVAEWLKAHAWKVCMRETVSRVRIPPPPPVFHL